MSNLAESINIAVDFCHNQAREMGWWDNPRETGTLLALVHSEISEALEGDRKNKMDDHLPDRKAFEVEIADAVIRLMDISGYYELDLGGAIRDKLAYNLNRPDHQKENRELEYGKKY